METNTTERRAIKQVWTVHEREISNIHSAAPILEPGRWKDFDPFLVLMEDKFEQGAFDVHPHRGIETVTFVINGKIEHYDSATGNGEPLREPVVARGPFVMNTEEEIQQAYRDYRNGTFY